MLLRKKNQPKKRSRNPQAKRARLLSEVQDGLKKGKVKTAVCIDLGSGFASISIFEGGKVRVVESPFDGPQTPTIAYYSEADGTWHVGSEASMLSYGDKSDNLAMHVKRNLYERPEEKLYGGGKFSAIEVTTVILKHLRKLILELRPDLAEYPQFGGSKKNAVELVILFTVPANWSVEQTTNYEMAIRAANFSDFDGFVSEPIAAVRHVSHLELVSLEENDLVLVGDVGAGTSDFVVERYKRGVFHQVTDAGGDAYLAGHDFTNALAADIAKQVGVKWDDVFDKGGLNLANVVSDDRPKVLAVWAAAEEAKKKLSVLDKVSVAITFPEGGRQMYSTDRSKAARLWKPLFARFRKGMSALLKDIEGGVKTINHIILVGGSASLPGLREEMAKALGCDVSRVVACKDSAHAISNGGAELAFFQNPSDSSLQSGLGFKVRSREDGGYENVLLVKPGEIMPADGYYIECADFWVSGSDSAKGKNKLLSMPFACRTGVRPRMESGQQVVLEDSEIIPFEGIETELKGWPPGEQEVTLGIMADANRRLNLLVRPTELPELEPLSIPLSLNASGDQAPAGQLSADIILILDCSSSMVGTKLQELIAGAQKFVRVAIKRGARVGVVVFPDNTTGGYVESKLICDLTDDQKLLASKIRGLAAIGGTPMHAGLDLAEKKLAKKKKKSSARAIGVLFTDGQPNNPQLATMAANSFKSTNRLLTVGIGKDVVRPFLLSIATSDRDFFMAECPEDILDAFKSVAHRLFSYSKKSGNGKTATNSKASSTSQAKQVVGSGESDSWDKVEGDDTEVA